jgi:hypothetical protein
MRELPFNAELPDAAAGVASLPKMRQIMFDRSHNPVSSRINTQGVTKDTSQDIQPLTSALGGVLLNVIY